MYYNLDTLIADDLGSGWSRVILDLGPTDTATNPASTARLIFGPATVEYLIAPSGAITTSVR